MYLLIAQARPLSKTSNALTQILIAIEFHHFEHTYEKK